MSRFMVVYSKVAEDQLAQAWLDAGPERNAVTTAANAMETMLASDPLGCGEPEHEGLRKLEIPPLRVLYAVEQDDLRVRVVLVRLLPPPPSPSQTDGVVPSPD